MKRIVHGEGARDKLLHVEAEGCIVNIQVGLHDDAGRKVTRVDIIPDGYVGEEWHADGLTSVRVIEGKAEPIRSYTVDNVPIQRGLRVVNYDRKHGVVIENGENYGTPEEPTWWYRVRADDGTEGSFDGTRLYSERNYKKGM